MSGAPSPGDPAPGEEAGRADASTGARPSRAPRRRPTDARRFPAWLAIPLAAFGGWWAAGWPGVLFGAVAGYFLWRARR